MAIISLICNVQRTSTILERAFRVLNREQVTVQVRRRRAAAAHHGCGEPLARRRSGRGAPRLAARPSSLPRGHCLGGSSPLNAPVPPPPTPLGPPPPGAQMMSQGASKTNIALIVDDAEAKAALRALHVEFFGSA